jgi:hypothetical protein
MMRGTIFGIVAIGTGVVMAPGMLNIDVSGDATGQTVSELLSPTATFIFLAFAVAVFGLLTAFYTDSGF